MVLAGTLSAAGFGDIEDEDTARLKRIVDSAKQIPKLTQAVAPVEEIIQTFAE
jgi:hypothetical protein